MQIFRAPVDVRGAVRHFLPVLPHPAECEVTNRPSSPSRRFGRNVHFNDRALADLHCIEGPEHAVLVSRGDCHGVSLAAIADGMLPKQRSRVVA